MGRFFRDIGARFRANFEPRFRSLPRGPGFVFGEKHRKLVLFIAAAVLGLVAYRVSSDEAKAEWLRTNRPAEETWNLLLSARHYVEVLDPNEIETLAPSLPFLKSGRDPRIWITEDSRVIVRFEPEGVRLFTLGRGTPERVLPGTWEPLGDGWEAFQALQTRTLPIPIETVTRRKTRTKKRPEVHDSRALRY